MNRCPLKGATTRQPSSSVGREVRRDAIANSLTQDQLRSGEASAYRFVKGVRSFAFERQNVS